MELPLAALGCKLSGYVPEVPPGQMQRQGAATHGQTCFAPNRYDIFWRPPLVDVDGSDSDFWLCVVVERFATVLEAVGKTVEGKHLQRKDEYLVVQSRAH